MSEGVTHHHAHVAWQGGREDLRAHTVRLGEQEIGGSAASEAGGDPAKADPEEMFVGSLSSCHMLWFLDHSRRQRLRVSRYEDEPEGEMDGTRFVRVVLRPRVEWEGDAPAPEVVDALHHRAHAACFIANSVTCPVEVEPR